MLVFAYDGSLNGDWVAHYAVRFAANTATKALRLVHVHEREAAPHIDARIARVAGECEVLGVQLHTELLARGRAEVSQRLLEAVPRGETWIMGTRARPRNGAFLQGTVTARVLAASQRSVIAIRVTHPGVLGQPGSALLALPGGRSVRPALPLFRLLGEDLRRAHVLSVHEVSSLHLRLLSAVALEALLAEGRTFVAGAEAELRARLAPHPLELDGSAVVSDQLSREILLCAARHRCRLICLGASERTLARRLVHVDPIEHVLAAAPSDVAVFRSVE